MLVGLQLVAGIGCLMRVLAVIAVLMGTVMVGAVVTVLTGIVMVEVVTVVLTEIVMAEVVIVVMMVLVLVVISVTNLLKIAVVEAILVPLSITGRNLSFTNDNIKKNWKCVAATAILMLVMPVFFL